MAGKWKEIPHWDISENFPDDQHANERRKESKQWTRITNSVGFDVWCSHFQTIIQDDYANISRENWTDNCMFMSFPQPSVFHIDWNKLLRSLITLSVGELNSKTIPYSRCPPQQLELKVIEIWGSSPMAFVRSFRLFSWWPTCKWKA